MFFCTSHIQRFSWNELVYVLLGPGDGDIFIDIFHGNNDITFVLDGNSGVV